MNWSQWRINQ